MKNRSLFALTLLAALTVCTPDALSQEKMSAEEKAKRAAAYTALVKPGPEHQRLETLVGKWETEIKYWMQPGQAPASFKGKCENRMILGGRFLLSESKGGEGPMSLESWSIVGFDRRHKKYTWIGLDTMGTYYVTAAGPYDESRKAVVMYGEDPDPVLGHTQKYDVVTRIASADQYITEIIFKDQAHTQGRGDFKVVEITHTRAK